MRARNGREGWGWVTRVLHWSMAGLILFQLGLGVAMVHLVADPTRQFDLYQSHKSWGFVIFALALLRITWRGLGGPRPDTPGLPAWKSRLSRGVQTLLYALMILGPLTGWISASASPTQDLLGIANRVFDAFALPDPWVPGREGLANMAALAHLACAILFGLALCAHVTGALGHLRDGILARMILRQ